jgi:hypothetical protein
VKLILLALIFYTAYVGAIVADPPPSAKLKQLRLQLDGASKPAVADEAQDAYAQLMKLGPSGFEVLAEAWAYDQISEKDWLEWKWDFLQKFVDSKGANDAADDAYTDYLDRKMVKDDKFATAAAQRLSGIQIYDDEAIISGWLGGGAGSRRVGYMALKQRHPDLPAFDYQADDSVRKKQLQEIEAFLKSKGTGT